MPTMLQLEVHLKSSNSWRHDPADHRPARRARGRGHLRDPLLRVSAAWSSSRRTTGNQRRYEQSELRRIAFIRTAQRVGLTLEEIAEALATLPEGRTPTKADWTRLSRTWRPRLDDQIRRIELLRDQLDSCIGCGCLSLKTCALRNPGDVAAAAGPGPVYLRAVTAPSPSH